MLRSIAAVVAGLIVTVVLVMVLTFLAAAIAGLGPADPPTPPYIVLNLIGGAIAGACGGAVAVRLAPHTPHGHVWALAFIILLLSLPTLFSAPSAAQPEWYGFALSFLGPVSVLIGGLIGVRWWRKAP